MKAVTAISLTPFEVLVTKTPAGVIILQNYETHALSTKGVPQ
jgi:hypothetical protein